MASFRNRLNQRPSWGSAPRRGASRPDPLSEQLRRQFELEFKAFHYRDWPDRKLPALDNKTPRQAARSASGRAALVALLKGMENLELRAAKDGSFLAYDFSWM